jgi:hypothetical protein
METQLAWLFTDDCPYVLIIGYDLLSKIGMAFDFTEMMLSAFGTTATTKPKHFYFAFFPCNQ